MIVQPLERLLKAAVQTRCFHTLPTTWSPEVLRECADSLRTHSRAVIKSSKRRAAVLVPLCNVEGKASVLFTLRSRNVGSHRGEVSFPGGKEDEGDIDLVFTALREADEEVGISKDAVQVIGKCSDAMSLHRIPVTPVVGFIGNDPPVLRGGAQSSFGTDVSGEVEEIFAISLEDLQNPDLQKPHKITFRAKFPQYLGGPHVVWGLTAYMLWDALRTMKIPGNRDS